MSDLLIVNGFVVDGSGAPAQRLDVHVSGGRISALGTDLAVPGARIIDAAGAIVAPGFIDSHTHYDAALFWDPFCDPMPQHGVTTVVIGNCSLGLAPMRPQDRVGQLDVFGYIEDIPTEVLNAAIPWQWESYTDYRRTMDERPLGVNVAAFVGHSQMRSFVMGEAAWQRAATPDERAGIVAQLEAALAAGAIGMSFSLFDKDRQGRPVPSILADEAELDALCAVLGRHAAGLQFVPRGDTTEMLIEDLRWIGERIGPHGVVGLYNIVVQVDADPGRAERVLGCLQDLHDQGVQLYGMASPRPFENAIGFDQGISFASLPAWNDLVQAAAVQKRAMARDPAWRARARDEVDRLPSVMFPISKPETLRIGTVAAPEHEQWIGRTLRDYAEARGAHPSDALADWLLDNDFHTTFIFAVANTNADDVVRLLKHPLTFVSGSDAGAHLLMFAGVGDPTLLLTRFVRDRGDFTLAEAVHALTGRQAALLGLRDRGRIAAGMAADLVIFDLDELTYREAFTVADVPGGHARMSRPAGGFRYTFVAGELVQEQGVLTDHRPGTFGPQRSLLG